MMEDKHFIFDSWSREKGDFCHFFFLGGGNMDTHMMICNKRDSL